MLPILTVLPRTFPADLRIRQKVRGLPSLGNDEILFSPEPDGPPSLTRDTAPQELPKESEARVLTAEVGVQTKTDIPYEDQFT